MYQKIKFLVFIASVAIIKFSFIGCGDSTYQMEYYSITNATSTYVEGRATSGQLSQEAKKELLTYVKNASGTGNKITYDANSVGDIVNRITEVAGAPRSDTAAVIESQRITIVWTPPHSGNHWFFYITNRNHSGNSSKNFDIENGYIENDDSYYDCENGGD